MIKQICRNECTEQIKASNITYTKIHTAVDLQGRRYLVFYRKKIWEIHHLERIPTYCGTLFNWEEVHGVRIGEAQPFSEIVDNYTKRGWCFYELDTIQDLPWWLAAHGK